MNSPSPPLPPPPPPKTPHRQKETSRDLRIKAQTLRDLEWSYAAIAKKLNITIRQVQRAVTHRPTPQKHKTGRKPKIDDFSLQILTEFVCASKRNRRMPFWQIPLELGWDVSADAIHTALKRAGFSRRLARKKPPISEKNRLLRLAWAIEHLDWTLEQWAAILWSDETWVNGSHHRRTWVTRRAGEEYDPTCVIISSTKKGGWMFWACFNGTTKGPCLFWEKAWGTINKLSYCEHIVPIIHEYTQQHPTLQFMQDHAPGHAAAYTQQEMRQRGIKIIEWPPFSPDLNFIKAV